jgi:hypothetical protein
VLNMSNSVLNRSISVLDRSKSVLNRTMYRSDPSFRRDILSDPRDEVLVRCGSVIFVLSLLYIKKAI